MRRCLYASFCLRRVLRIAQRAPTETCLLPSPSFLVFVSSRVLPMPVHHLVPLVPFRGPDLVTKRSSRVTLRSRGTPSTANGVHVHLSLGDLHRALRQPVDLSVRGEQKCVLHGGTLTTGEPVTFPTSHERTDVPTSLVGSGSTASWLLLDDQTGTARQRSKSISIYSEYQRLLRII